MLAWTATQTRQLPALAAALPTAGIETVSCGKPAGRNGSGRQRT
jgi:hypothetical protein